MLIVQSAHANTMSDANSSIRRTTRQGRGLLAPRPSDALFGSQPEADEVDACLATAFDSSVCYVRNPSILTLEDAVVQCLGLSQHVLMKLVNPAGIGGHKALLPYCSVSKQCSCSGWVIPAASIDV